jgi:hypothetical protein
LVAVICFNKKLLCFNLCENTSNISYAHVHQFSSMLFEFGQMYCYTLKVSFSSTCMFDDRSYVTVFRWPYPFLDLASSGAPLWYVLLSPQFTVNTIRRLCRILTATLIWCRYLGMAIAHVPCFTVYWLVVKGKQAYFPRMFPRAYVRTSN